jgi:hypothetical protein
MVPDRERGAEGADAADGLPVLLAFVELLPDALGASFSGDADLDVGASSIARPLVSLAAASLLEQAALDSSAASEIKTAEEPMAVGRIATPGGEPLPQSEGKHSDHRGVSESMD